MLRSILIRCSLKLSTLLKKNKHYYELSKVSATQLGFVESELSNSAIFPREVGEIIDLPKQDGINATIIAF
ncbi:hypothetical protein CXF95_09780 [Paraglaciecola sp. MB-3u-78]|nr:hypothetical protein CXF95_09780 [Paraglaciecola sp. MB-3u-78]